MTLRSPPRVGIYEKALPPDDWPQMLASARSVGFAFVEMSVDESDDRLARLDWDLRTRDRVAAAVVATGTPIYSMCLSAHRRFGLGSSDKEVRAAAESILRRAVDLAVDLGIRVIQIAGYQAYYETPEAQTAQRYVAGLQAGLSYAAERGVMLGVENIDTPDLASAADILSLVSRLDSPWFRAYPDAGNFAVHGLDVAAELDEVLPISIGLHLKDARLNEPRRVTFGEGTVPFDDVLHVVAHSAYTGPFTLEMWNDDPRQALDRAAKALTWVTSRMAAATRKAEIT